MRIRRLTHDHRICTRPDLLRGGAIQAKARRLANRLSEGAPILLQRTLDDGQLTKNSIVLQMNTVGQAKALEVQTDEFDASILTIEAPFELRRQGVEGKIIVGNHAPQRDRNLLRAMSKA